MIARVRSTRLHPPTESIDSALTDPNLLGAALGDPSSWSTWLTVLRAANGLPLDSSQAETFASIAGGRPPPKRRVRELWAVVGARGGKTRMAGALSAHTAVLQRHHLAPGETGHVLTISPTRDQANIVSNYAHQFIACSPVLAQELDGEPTQTEIRLRNGVVIGTHPCSYRSVRGRTLLTCILDECAFFRDEGSAVPDREIYRAITPRIIRGGMLIGISTGYRKVGLLYDKHRDYFGVDDPDVLVVSGTTQQFNPTFDRSLIERSIRDDPEAAHEWSGDFRADISGFLSEADIDACIDHDRPMELPPRSGVVYRAFGDPSGGRADHYTIAISHMEGVRIVIDVVRGAAPPFDPMQVTAEYAALAKQYGVREIVGDNYSAEWVVGAFRDAGLRYLRAELSKSKIYYENQTAFTRRIASLPNQPRLLHELRFLERQKHAGGTETIDHPKRGGHDDYSNACFGAIHYALRKKPQARLFTLSDITSGGGVELDPRTGRPIGRDDPPRIKWITVDEASVPAARGV